MDTEITTNFKINIKILIYRIKIIFRYNKKINKIRVLLILNNKILRTNIKTVIKFSLHKRNYKKLNFGLLRGKKIGHQIKELKKKNKVII